MYFTSQGVTFTLTGPGAPEVDAAPRVQPVSHHGVVSTGQATLDREERRWTVKLDFVDANPDPRPVGEEPSSASINYFKGPRQGWKTGPATYASLVYRDLWPGIDLFYTGTGGRLKCTYLVRPGADPNQIQMAYRGATAVRISEAGQLEVSTPVGGLADDKSYSYQQDDGPREEVATEHVLKREASGRAQYGFRLGAYDPQEPLVLDPAVLVYAGYIGGADRDLGQRHCRKWCCVLSSSL